MAAAFYRITGWILTIFGSVVTVWGLIVLVSIIGAIPVPGEWTDYVFVAKVLVFGVVWVGVGLPAWWGGRRLRRLAGRETIPPGDGHGAKA